MNNQDHLIYNIDNINQAYNSVCYDYLYNLYPVFKKAYFNYLSKNSKKSEDNEIIKNIYREFVGIFSNPYSPQIGYGDKYAKINEYLKQNINLLLKNKEFHDVIIALYEGQNNGLEIAYECFKKGNHKKNTEKSLNLSSPTKANDSTSRLNSVIGNYYIANTNIPNSKDFSHKTKNDSKEIRMGCQVEEINGKNVINPLYQAYLEVKKYRYSLEKSRFSSIYFNLLKRDPKQESDNTERRKEGLKTKALEALDDPKNGIAVITLPADDNLLDLLNIGNTDTLNFITVKTQIIEQLQNGNDFYISDELKNIILESENNKNFNDILKELLDKSSEFLGFKDKKNITKSESHSLMFHFIKYELTNFILEKLKPETHNFTCKDGIDRGASHSLYFNTMKSITTNSELVNNKVTNKLNSPNIELVKDISHEDFVKYLDAASILVKGRQMNDHRFFIANTINIVTAANTSNNINTPHFVKEWAETTMKSAPGFLKKFAKITEKSLKPSFFKFGAWYYRDKDLGKEIYTSEVLENLNKRQDQIVSKYHDINVTQRNEASLPRSSTTNSIETKANGIGTDAMRIDGLEKNSKSNKLKK